MLPVELPFGWKLELAESWILWFRWFLQLAILVLLISFTYHRFIKNSQSEQILKGMFVILLTFVGAWGASSLLGFPLLERVFGASIQLLIIGLIVIFQPELRRLLLFLGQPELFSKPISTEQSHEKDPELLVQEVSEAVKFLSKSRTGALIVLESGVASSNYLEIGTALDAKLSTEMLLTIFQPKTPLHDGAVVINAENRIVAAGVLLPLTEDPKLSWQYGTRHRAAIGLTEVSDSRCIVVSEETGTISIAYHGTLEKVASAEDFRKRLEKLYKLEKTEKEGSLKNAAYEKLTEVLFSAKEK